VPLPLVARLREAAGLAFGALGVVGYARADFRVTPEDEIVFLEVNALPSLAPIHNELYLRRSPRDVIAAIVAARVTISA
jgi:D-alanine-D-alanine ligase-like ATP-grasp enzyme